jgi:multidrug efflux system outer membrane protein
MEPKYQTPTSDVPFAKAETDKKQINEIAWQDFFQSADLQKTIALALKNNHDLKIASLNIESARAIHGVARANLFPTINATASETKQGITGPFAAFTPKKIYRANLNFNAYEFDLFGRLRSLKQSAYEDLLASEEMRNLVKITLISEVVNSYAQLMLDYEILEISRENLTALEEKHLLIEQRFHKGMDSKINFLDSIAALENTKLTIETYQKLVDQDRHALMSLIGIFDEKYLPQAKKLEEIKIAEDALEFTASQSLLSRPDIKQAEHNLKSANANIGAARAAFFPTISLTGSFGYQSRELTDLFDSKSWSFTPQINLPIFTGGSNLANLDRANVEKEIEIIAYKKAIQTAFREALDKISERKALSNQLKSVNKILDAKETSYKISKAKQEQGLINKLDRINSKLEMLAAKQNNLSLKKEYLTNMIELYKALGGGSEVEKTTK